VHSTAGVAFLSFSLVVSLALPISALAGNAAHGTKLDNGGRKIAIVVPHTRSSSGHNGEDSAGASEQKYEQIGAELKTVVGQGTEAARGLSRLALRRAGDLSGWITAVWHEMNEFPVATPNSAATRPEPPTHLMRPLTEPSQKNFEFWYTKEKRMKMVVSR
jgi:hypothetical protein